VIGSPYAERLKADGKWMVTICACGMNLVWLFQYGAAFGESLFTIAHHDELQSYGCFLETALLDVSTNYWGLATAKQA
jgi:hypothetical protein